MIIACTIPAKNAAVILTADDIEILTGGRMIQLCHDTAGCTDPAGFIRGLQIAVVVAVLNRTAVIGPRYRPNNAIDSHKQYHN